MFGDKRINLGCYYRYNENKTPLRLIVINKSVPVTPDAQGLHNSALYIRFHKYRNILEKLHNWFTPLLRSLFTERKANSDKMEANI